MRLVIVSNRLPFTIEKGQNGLSFQPSTGGLTTGLTAFLEWWKKQPPSTDYVWIGWPGTTVPENEREEVAKRALAEHQSIPIFLDQEEMESFYYGFCNSTVWPLFHYFSSYAKFDEKYWAQFKSVNAIFAEAIIKEIRPGDVVWIHDYQLMLLPRLLRNRLPDTAIGFFLHIPFPSYEVFRLMPTKWRSEITEGLLGADLLGFHTIEYVTHFLRCCLRILGQEHSYGRMIREDRVVRADAFPLGIDVSRFTNLLKSEGVREERKKLRKQLGDLKVILSLDRLDYTKGVGNRLEAYRDFLEKNPQWHRRVVLVLSIAPSRLKALHYQEMKDQIDKLVGEVNGRFGSIDWTPVVYQYKYMPLEELAAMLSLADVGLVTPLRDGMNLVAKEYIATRTDGGGVLVLSEMAGASKELGEAIIVNPNDTSEISDALKTALETPQREQASSNQAMRTRLEHYDITRWGQDFVGRLLDIKEEQKRLNQRLLDTKAREELLSVFKAADTRLFLLDYDGSLTPFRDDPKSSKPGKNLMEVLTKLAADPKNKVVLLSGRDRSTLQEWFGATGITLVAEYGAWVRERDGEWQLSGSPTSEWKKKILPILEMYVNRVPGSFVEEKEFSLAWHHRKADPELSSIRTKELTDELSRFLENTELQVSQLAKVVEVKNATINKGVMAKNLLASISPGFVLAVGDDQTDEEMFNALPHSAYSVRVGWSQSLARFNLRFVDDVVRLLSDLAALSEPQTRPLEVQSIG